MAEQQEKKFQDLYAEGYYEAVILDNTFTQKKLPNSEAPDPNATPYLVVQIKVTKMKKTLKGGPAATNQIMDGHRSISLFFTEKSLEYTKEFLKQAQFRGSDIRVLDAKHPQHVNLKGFAFEVKCTHQTFNGKVRDKFDHQVFAAGGKWMESLASPSNAKLLGLNALWNVNNSGVASAAKHIETATTSKRDPGDDEGQEPFAPVSDNDAPPTYEWD